MKKFIIPFLFITPLYAQTVDPVITELQSSWNSKTYIESQFVKTLDALIKKLDAANKELESVKKERDELKIALEARLKAEKND